MCGLCGAGLSASPRHPWTTRRTSRPTWRATTATTAHPRRHSAWTFAACVLVVVVVVVVICCVCVNDGDGCR